MTGFSPYVSLLGSMVCAGLGGFVLSRNPKSGANRSFAAGMGALALSEFGVFLAGIYDAGSSGPAYRKIALTGEIFLAIPWVLFGQSLVHVDTSRSRFFRRVGTISACLASVCFFMVLALDVSVEPFVSTRQAGAWLSIFLILALTATLAMFEFALRKADHGQRWRIKFLLLGIGAILGTRIFVHSQYLLFPYAARDYSLLTTFAILIGCALVAFSLVRHQLLDVDVFVSRYFVYNSFTVAAVGAYLLLVGLTAQVIRSIGGSLASFWGLLFILVSVLGLATVLLSTMVRKKVAIFINRNFYRNRYDYHKEWLTFTERLSSKLEVGEISAPIKELFHEILWAENTRIWLCDDHEVEFHELLPSGAFAESSFPWDARLVRFLKARGYPATADDLESIVEPGAPEDTRREMDRNGILVLVPLMTGDRLIGVLACGKSRSGHPFDTEDFDLMNTVTRQAANSFLIARLSQTLIRAKEMEAFHAFSAFVLHDMKNFVSMLSLVVQNADRNLDNPEFRKDAMRSISQTVEKMKRMMERLAALSREPDHQGESVDLDGLVREIAAEMKGSVRSRILEELGGPLPVVADPVEIRKVVTNLIMNAEEATAPDGEIRLLTFARDGKSVLAVSDNGCGMTPEFVSESLFKPFATTKSQGFGIGLYQVKKIVEAHQGLIEVESAVGQGTTVRVLLPQAAG